MTRDRQGQPIPIDPESSRRDVIEYLIDQVKAKTFAVFFLLPSALGVGNLGFGVGHWSLVIGHWSLGICSSPPASPAPPAFCYKSDWGRVK
ncbi:MAG: hypothetical protein D6728_02500 [Cyanobacteria bacterium J055]|nr:MAG: hypothetical protein D6728_02500 [Cyanobacteria bacterium J055]